MTAVLDVVVNGARWEVPSGTTVADVVHEVTGRLTAEGWIAVAVDGEVVRRGEWHAPLRTGSRVDVLAAAQGG